jgi:hypothetical protein
MGDAKSYREQFKEDLHDGGCRSILKLAGAANVIFSALLLAFGYTDRMSRHPAASPVTRPTPAIREEFATTRAHVIAL